MPEQENVRVVQQAYENFKTGNIQGLLGLFAEDIEWVLPQIKNVSFSGKRKGLSEVGQFFSMVNEQQEALQFEPTEYVAQGDKVVALGNYVWRIKATGRRAESQWVHVFTFRNGRVIGFREYMDTAAFATAYS
jgi:uncharacterized protein